MEKEIKIIPPEGYEIDKENSTLECIKFKPITKRWRDDENAKISGYYISDESHIWDAADCCCKNEEENYNLFASKKQAKSALAMARISQIMANDERFGGIITDEEWSNFSTKYCITRCENEVDTFTSAGSYNFLAFHTIEQRDLFLKENEDLVKDYLML